MLPIRLLTESLITLGAATVITGAVVPSSAGAPAAVWTSLPMLTESGPVGMILVVTALSLVPLLVVGTTAFLKISVVLSILRNAIGAQGIPSSAVIVLLTLVLTLHVMTPVGMEMFARMESGRAVQQRSKVLSTPHGSKLGKKTSSGMHSNGRTGQAREITHGEIQALLGEVQRIAAPLEQFMRRHCALRERLFFARTASDAALPVTSLADAALPVASLADASLRVPSLADASLPAASTPRGSFPVASPAAAPSAASPSGRVSSTSPPPGGAALGGSVGAEAHGPCEVDGVAVPGTEWVSDVAGGECIVRGESLITLIPSFVLSELRTACALGVSVFLPFIVVDLVVANLLVALGLTMVNPVTISLPVKLLLFAVGDAWFLVCRGLVLSYGQ